MPHKKKPFVYSIDPALFARSHAPATTIAMGMKNSQASSLCWVKQVQREESIREVWESTYDVQHKRAEQEVQAVARTRARDAARHETYVNPDNNTELYNILYKRAPPSSLCDSAAATVAAAKAPSSTLQTNTATAAPGEASRAPWDPVDSAYSLTARTTTEEYLQARRRNHTLQKRYPHGPATTAQTVGWPPAATDEGSASSLMSSSLPHRQMGLRKIGAYRKPEDEEHALLFGYDCIPK
ncbi:hypothetical protein JKF63_06094 [Porcisia hertigi]|uniref:Uncharacterized protein n=1 Tax=Porcisia hertigi TaxID=2761500 RepID=A0A836ID10_9TRYP|nr:hypothetical protein JKF63_06094 [Porcisia hertigi]